MDLDDGIEIIIFESILITLVANFIFEAAGAVAIFGLNLKSNHQKQI
jgi:hypothetical protein